MNIAILLGLLVAAAPAPAQEGLAEARRAAFPEGGGIREGDRIVLFERSILIRAPFGPVLISAGAIQDASHGDQGRIAVHYLRETPGGFAVRRAFPLAMEAGSHGFLSDWSVSRRFTALPVVYTEGGGTFQGYTCVAAGLLELRPDGPAQIGLIPIYYDDSGAVEGGPRTLRGRISNLRRGRAFDVIFTGTARFTEHYLWRDGRFVRTGRESRASC